jgi:hypothetical protein
MGRPSAPILPSLTLTSGTAPRARAHRGEVPADGRIQRKRRIKVGHGREPWTRRFGTTMFLSAGQRLQLRRSRE